MSDAKLDFESLVSRFSDLEEQHYIVSQYAARVKNQLDDLSQKFKTRPEIQYLEILQGSIALLSEQVAFLQQHFNKPLTLNKYFDNKKAAKATQLEKQKFSNIYWSETTTSTGSKILVVDSDPAIRNLIHRFFSHKNYQVESAGDGKTAVSVFEQFEPDLVILDVNLPDATGYSLCKEMQSRTNVFILLLASRSDPRDKVMGFEVGADDYLTKPFDLQELQYRVGAILKRRRRITSSQSQRLTFNELAIDPIRREVTLKGEPIILSALDFKLLHFLASHPNQVWSRPELIKHVWNDEKVEILRVVDVHIGQIRKKIEVDVSQPSLIKTVRGVGYKFEVPSKSDDS